MVRVEGSTGEFVEVTIIGINDTMQRLRRIGLVAIKKAEIAMAQVANLTAQEVQESIIGNRGEERSVRTGRFGSTVIAEPVNTLEYNVRNLAEVYPESKQGTTTADVARFMEKKRHHFRNTKNRMAPKIQDKFEQAMKNLE